MNQDMIARARARRARSAVPLLAIGGVCGLAWAAGLRGFMAELAGSDSTISWYGTFAQILLPGLIAGVLLGWAEHIRRTGGRRGWRWLAAAPLAFIIAVFVSPDVFRAVANGQPLLSGGIGGGAIAVPLFGMAGGYALSGRGPRWSRIVLGVVALAPIPAWAFASLAAFGPEFALTTPRGAWLALLYYSFMATLNLACTIPHRPVLPATPEAQPHSATGSEVQPTFTN
jgi:MFS family permease